MKEKFYYSYWEAFAGKHKGLNIVTACTIYNKKTGQVSRGISVCSESDEPHMIEGRFRARNHALRALKGRGDTYITDRRAIKQILCTDCPFIKHVDMKPSLTYQERRALFGYKNMLFNPRKEDPDAHWKKEINWAKIIRNIWGKNSGITVKTNPKSEIITGVTA